MEYDYGPILFVLAAIYFVLRFFIDGFKGRVKEGEARDEFWIGKIIIAAFGFFLIFIFYFAQWDMRWFWIIVTTVFFVYQTYIEFKYIDNKKVPFASIITLCIGLSIFYVLY